MKAIVTHHLGLDSPNACRIADQDDWRLLVAFLLSRLWVVWISRPSPSDSLAYGSISIRFTALADELSNLYIIRLPSSL